MSIFISNKDTNENELIYIRDFESVQKTRSRVYYQVWKLSASREFLHSVSCSFFKQDVKYVQTVKNHASKNLITSRRSKKTHANLPL